MSDKQKKLLNKIYNEKHLQCQSKSLFTKLMLLSDDSGKVEIDREYLKEVLPLKDDEYYKECMHTLYKYKWLTRQGKDTYINYNLIQEV